MRLTRWSRSGRSPWFPWTPIHLRQVALSTEWLRRSRPVLASIQSAGRCCPSFNVFPRLRTPCLCSPTGRRRSCRFHISAPAPPNSSMQSQGNTRVPALEQLHGCFQLTKVGYWARVLTGSKGQVCGLAGEEMVERDPATEEGTSSSGTSGHSLTCCMFRSWTSRTGMLRYKRSSLFHQPNALKCRQTGYREPQRRTS